MRKVLFSVVVAGVLSSSLFAGPCVLAQTGAVDVVWTGYKTEKKVGVSGGFDGVVYTPVKKEGDSFKDILVGSKVTIDTAKVNSKNSARDEKLAKFFFGMMNSKNIEAKIVAIKADKTPKGAPRGGVVDVEISMNGVKKVTQMKYVYGEDLMFNASGVIDLADFDASKALSSINQACYDLHEGKTWSEVGISFKTKIEATLCNAKPLK